MNEKIITYLRTLRVPIYYIECGKQTDKYILFNIYREVEVDIFDNESLADVYYIQINYWYKDGHDMNLYKEIKRILKLNGFIFNSCRDNKDGDYYGKCMDFIYKQRHLN